MTAFILLSLTAPRPALTFPKPHYPLLCTITLASLVKGRWIDGKAQVLILLLSACNMPTIFMLQIFCCQDGGIASPPPFAPHQPFQNRTIPRKALSPLPLNERFVGFASVQSWSFAVGASCTDFLRPLVSIRA